MSKAEQRAGRLYRVQGYVQGVGFRWFVQQVATELGISGSVRNLHDGSVEVYAIGDERQLSGLRRRLEQGPAGARVTDVSESPAPLRESSRFSIEH